MSLERATVVLVGPESLGSASLAGVAARAAAGDRVILVVQPPCDQAEIDARRAEALGPLGDPFARAVVLNAGPTEAAARASSVLADLGISVALADPRRAAPVTSGHPLDARPRHIDARWYERTLGRASVVVVAGGVGIDELRRATNLGAEGAALTAVFLASAMALPLIVADAQPGSGQDSISGRKARLMARDRGVTVRSGQGQHEWATAGPLGRLTDEAVVA